MSVPDVSLTIRDNALGIAPAATGKAHLKIGVAPLGLLNTVYGFGDTTSLTAALGKGGALVEAAALALQGSGGYTAGTVYAIAANPSTYGAVGAVTKTATQTGSTAALAIAAQPFQSIKVKCVLGGAVATATMQISTDGGLTYGATFVTAATVMAPGVSFLTLAFAVGVYVAADTWTIATDGTITFVGTGNNGVTVSTISPVDAYAIVATCSLGGALGAAQFTYSLDNGNTVSGSILVPASGKYVIPDCGLLFTFSGALVAGDAWACTVTGAAYSTTDLTNAMTAALADSRTWAFVHAVGPASTASGAASVLSTLDTQLATAQAVYRFAGGMIEVPVDTDANLLTAFAASSSLRVMAAAGFEYVTSPLNSRQQYVSTGRVSAARAGAVPPSEDLGRVASGALGAASLKPTNAALTVGRDEAGTPGLDAGRFCVHRSVIGRQGTYVNNPRIMAPNGSDYSFWQNRRVMDVACATVRNTLLNFLNASIRVNADGTINEKDAQAIEAQCYGDLSSALLQPGDASLAFVVVNRTTNVLSTQMVNVSVRVTPLGYAKLITVDIGFQSPNIVKSQ